MSVDFLLNSHLVQILLTKLDPYQPLMIVTKKGYSRTEENV